LTVDVTEDRKERHCKLRVAIEVGRLAERAFEPIGDAQRGVGRNQRAKPVPVALIEPLDVQSQQTLRLV